MAKTEKVMTGRVLLGVMIVFCAIIAMQVLAEEHGGSEMTPSGGRWQHLALTEVIDDTPKSELAGSINKLGREGWELVSVGNIAKSGTTTKTVFYFKKPL